MTPEAYRTALSTLGLTQQAAGRWLRVSPKTAQNYAKHGPSGPASVAVEMRLERAEHDRVLACARERAADEGERAINYVSEVNYLLDVLKRIFILGRPSGWPSDLWREICVPALPSDNSDIAASIRVRS